MRTFAGQVSAPYTFDDVAVLPELVTGYVYCDNAFQLYVNGDLVYEDPLAFTPHNAVRVEFDYDGGSDKTYAIMCRDYASRDPRLPSPRGSLDVSSPRRARERSTPVA